MVDLGEEERVCREEEVQGAVESCDVGAEDCHQGPKEQEFRRAEEVLDEGDLGRRLVLVGYMGVFGRFLEESGFPGEEHRGVGFFEDQERENCYDGDLINTS